MLGLGGQGGQALAPRGVEFGEDVVEDEDRGVAVVSEQLEGSEPKRQGDRPGFAVGGVALDGHRAEAQGQVVAVRAHEVDAALGFLLAHGHQGGEHALRLGLHVGEVGTGRVVRVCSDDSVDRGVEGEAQVARGVGDVVVGARGRLFQARGDGRARGRDARGQRCELLIPDLEGRQVGGLTAANRGLGGLHERGALAGDPIEVGAHGGVDGGELRGQVVQERAARRTSSSSAAE